MVLNGPATDIDFLREEDLDSMDAFLALSNETEKNIIFPHANISIFSDLF